MSKAGARSSASAGRSRRTHLPLPLYPKLLEAEIAQPRDLTFDPHEIRHGSGDLLGGRGRAVLGRYPIDRLAFRALALLDGVALLAQARDPMALSASNLTRCN